MRKIYLFTALLLCSALSGMAQLTVSAFANNSTVCAGGGTLITASATPVGYTVSSVANSLSFNPGTDLLADAGVAVVPTSAGSTLDDCRWDNISLPFSFRFYGNVYSTIHVSSNGWIGMGNTGSTTTGMGFTLPNASSPNNVIHGLTADLDLRGASGGSLEYFVEGGAPNRIFVVSYTNVLFRTGGGSVSFQVKLFESSNVIEIHTESFTNTTLAKAQGVENAAGTVANTVTGRNNTTNWTSTGFTNGYRFTPDVINFAWSPSAGLSSTTGASVTATPNGTTIYTVTATNASNGATGSFNTTITVDPASYVLAATPAAGGAVVCQNKSVSGSTDFRDGNCNLLANILPSGASPVGNVVNTCVRLDTGATKKGTIDLYVARNYDITPQVNPASATATLTLYFLQSEFNRFNLRAADSGHTLLPTGPGDATGIANLVLRQFHGTGTRPGAYSGGTFVDFTSVTAGTTITWNATRNWWEVRFPVAGFSGFYVTSKKTAPVPITLEYFRGSRQGKLHQFAWKVNCTSAQAVFSVERSSDGVRFAGIGGFTATQERCQQAFDFTDANPLGGLNYYRLKITDVDGKAAYSATVSLLNKESGLAFVNLVPSLVTSSATLNISSDINERVQLTITDMSGRRVHTQQAVLVPGGNPIAIRAERLQPGIYQLTGHTDSGKTATVRFVKQ
jgi:hypothetical protein